MRIWTVAAQLIDTALDICVPPLCVACERPIFHGSLCSDCRILEPIGEDICTRCGSQTPVRVSRCGNCYHPCFPLNGTRSRFWLGASARSLLHKAKYQGRMELLSIFKETLSELSLPFPKPLVVIPVPMHPWKLVWRGSNQAEILAGWVAKVLGLELLVSGLCKPVTTTAQSTLSRKERLRNQARAFRWKEKVPVPERVLLIDDVLTTGATLSRCAATLRQAGVAEVYAWTLFRPRSGLSHSLNGLGGPAL